MPTRIVGGIPGGGGSFYAPRQPRQNAADAMLASIMQEPDNSMTMAMLQMMMQAMQQKSSLGFQREMLAGQQASSLADREMNERLANLGNDRAVEAARIQDMLAQGQISSNKAQALEATAAREHREKMENLMVGQAKTERDRASLQVQLQNKEQAGLAKIGATAAKETSVLDREILSGSKASGRAVRDGEILLGKYEGGGLSFAETQKTTEQMGRWREKVFDDLAKIDSKESRTAYLAEVLPVARAFEPLLELNPHDTTPPSDSPFVSLGGLAGAIGGGVSKFFGGRDTNTALEEQGFNESQSAFQRNFIDALSGSVSDPLGEQARRGAIGERAALAASDLSGRVGLSSEHFARQEFPNIMESLAAGSFGAPQAAAPGALTVGDLPGDVGGGMTPEQEAAFLQEMAAILP